MILKIGNIVTVGKLFLNADLRKSNADIRRLCCRENLRPSACNLRESALKDTFSVLTKVERGFTLIEMIVVLSIIGIILGVSLPFFSQFIASARLKTAVRDVVTTLSTARSYAITKRADCSVVFDLEKEEYWIEILGSVLEKRNKAPQGIDLLDTTFHLERVTFLPTGALIGSSGSITIIDKGGRTKLVRVINVTGKIKVE